MTSSFTEIGDGVYVLRYPVLDVNVTLVVGDGAALVVDTLSTDTQARELREAVRTITGHPCLLVNTHDHFDHCFGNAVWQTGQPDIHIWAQQETAVALRERGQHQQRATYEQYAAQDPQFAADLAAVTIVPPTHTVHRHAELQVGGRTVTLHHLGRGHTAGDLVVRVPDADILVAGDLVEESGPPAFGDAYPIEWPETLAQLRRLAGPDTRVVPGHGAVVDPRFVAAQGAQLAALAWLIRDGHATGAPPARVAEAAAARTDLPQAVALTAAQRGYAELSGRAERV